MQKEGQKGLTGLGRQKPCKKFGGKRQKILSGAQPSQREREESLKSFEKVTLKKSNLTFKKNMIHEFRSIEKQPRSIEIDRDFNKTVLKEFDRLKINFNRSKQTEALSNKFKNFRSIKKQNGSIEIDKGSPNLRKNTVFEKHLESTQSIEI